MLAFNILLSDTDSHLQNINETAFSACSEHSFEIVALGQTLLSTTSSIMTSLVKNLIYSVFKKFHHCASWFSFQLKKVKTWHGIMNACLQHSVVRQRQLFAKLMKLPYEPAVTIAFKLLLSDKLF